MLVKILLSIGLLAVPFTSAYPLDTNTDPSASPVDAPAGVQKDVAAAAANVVATAESAESQTWTLRYKFLPDQQLRYKNTENVTLDAMQGELRKVDVTSFEQRRVFTVDSVDEAGAAKLAMQYEFVRMKRQTNEFPPVIFDTNMEAKDIPPEFKNTARDLKGSAPKFWISNLGAALQESDSTEGYRQSPKPVAQAGNVIVGDKPAGAVAGDVAQAVAESSTKSRKRRRQKNPVLKKLCNKALPMQSRS